MKNKTNRNQEKIQAKSVSSMIREAIDSNGYKDIKECARSIKVPYDLFNKVVGGHIPKDAQLAEYAKKLNIDSRELILAAYREKAPQDMKQYFNSVLLLENHHDNVQETLDLMDAFSVDQMEELLAVARLIRNSPRDYCRKALALMALYQQMPPDLIEYFDSLVLMSLRREDLDGLKEFREEIEIQRMNRISRRGRLRA